MSEVFDLDALEADANKEPFRFRHGGEEFELPFDPDILTVDLFSTGQIAEPLRQLLGAEQYARLNANPATFGASKFMRLMEAYQKHIGVGESSGG